MKNKVRTYSKLFEIQELKQKDIEQQVKRLIDDLNHEQKKLELMEEMMSDNLIKFIEKQKMEILHTNEMELFYEYFCQMNRNIDAQRILISKKLNELDSTQGALLKTYQEKKIYENLKDKLCKESEKNIIATTQKEMDFLYISRKNRDGE